MNSPKRNRIPHRTKNPNLVPALCAAMWVSLFGCAGAAEDRAAPAEDITYNELDSDTEIATRTSELLEKALAGDPEVCLDPIAGCPCDEEGVELECGRVYRRSGDYVACSIGHRICEGGVWSPCEGARVVELGHDDVPPSYALEAQASAH